MEYFQPTSINSTVYEYSTRIREDVLYVHVLVYFIRVQYNESWTHDKLYSFEYLLYE